MAPAKATPNPIARVAVLLISLASAAPAVAQEAQQITVYGEVAPRCWVADPLASNTAMPPARGRAICNHARPVLLTEMRAIAADGSLVKLLPASVVTQPTGASLSPRAALEIVVTPLL
ncbi:MAG: hypothetical protein Q7T68_12795 [Sphingopyxis sp.]|nr:hypothetical protein [Sphingopyxis sp.]